MAYFSATKAAGQQRASQEVADLFPGLDHDGAGIGSQQALVEQGRDGTVDAPVCLLDQTWIGQRDAIERGHLRGHLRGE